MICTGCKDDKAETDFAFRSKATGKRKSVCRGCTKIYGDAWYLRNRKAHGLNVRRNNARYKTKCAAFVLNYLRTHPCVDCGEADPIVLDFDHVRGKKSFNVSRAKYDGISFARLNEEIAKCEVRCANDHRRRHVSARWGSNPR